MAKSARPCVRSAFSKSLARSPQARGRSERAFGTIQGRLPQELRHHGISEYDAANRYLEQHLLARYDAADGPLDPGPHKERAGRAQRLASKAVQRVARRSEDVRQAGFQSIAVGQRGESERLTLKGDIFEVRA
jgi:hypothetical protein